LIDDYTTFKLGDHIPTTSVAKNLKG